ncbi:MAG: DUF2007 domain-containing protein [Ignavibacteria bacterium]
MNNEDSETLVTVYSISNHAIIALIKSMLDDAEIQYLAKGDNFQNVYSYFAFPVEFQVMAEDEAYAKELLKDICEDSYWSDENSPEDPG